MSLHDEIYTLRHKFVMENNGTPKHLIMDPNTLSALSREAEALYMLRRQSGNELTQIFGLIISVLPESYQEHKKYLEVA